MSEKQEGLFIGHVSEKWKTYLQYVKLREICYSLRKRYSIREAAWKTYIQYLKRRETCYSSRKTYTQYMKLSQAPLNNYLKNKNKY